MSDAPRKLTLKQEGAQHLAAGRPYFRVGEVSCGKGHTEGRYSSSAGCVTCARETSAKKYKADPAKCKAEAKAWQHKNPEKVAASKLKEARANPAKFAARQRAWVKANPEKAKAGEKRRRARRKDKAAAQRKQRRKDNPALVRAQDALWAKKNPEKAAAKTAIRRARKKSQICECCTKQDFIAIYDWARFLGYEVDHKVPLALGGSHCCSNLQVLSIEDHKEKTARDMADILAARKGTPCE